MVDRPIPADIMQAAELVAVENGLGARGSVPRIIAMGIMGERDRCKHLAYREKDKHGEDGAVACLEIALAILNGEQP